MKVALRCDPLTSCAPGMLQARRYALVVCHTLASTSCSRGLSGSSDGGSPDLVSSVGLSPAIGVSASAPEEEEDNNLLPAPPSAALVSFSLWRPLLCIVSVPGSARVRPAPTHPLMCDDFSASSRASDRAASTSPGPLAAAPSSFAAFGC